MTLMRWSPMNAAQLHNRWNRMFDEIFNSDESEHDMQRVWRPRVDVAESENEVRVMVDLPGVRKDDVSITLENGVLTISGERKHEEENRDENVHFAERVYGHFSRSFTLQETLNTEKIEAKFTDGVLTISLPKVEQAKPKKIEIKAA